MFRSVRPYLEQAGIDDPVVCYQGAVVADPRTGEFLRHEPIPLELAREAITVLQEEGFHVNCYVNDELYVAEVTPKRSATPGSRTSRSMRSEISPRGSRSRRRSWSPSTSRRSSTSSRPA